MEMRGKQGEKRWPHAVPVLARKTALQVQVLWCKKRKRDGESDEPEPMRIHVYGPDCLPGRVVMSSREKHKMVVRA
jgi:hypothetical protein